MNEEREAVKASSNQLVTRIMSALSSEGKLSNLSDSDLNTVEYVVRRRSFYQQQLEHLYRQAPSVKVSNSIGSIKLSLKELKSVEKSVELLNSVNIHERVIEASKSLALSLVKMAAKAAL